MRGEDIHQDHLYSYVSPEQRVPADHPLRPIRQMANIVLERLSPQLDALYSAVGRPSIPPEKLLRALRCSTRSAASACSWKRWTTTSCSAGL